MTQQFSKVTLPTAINILKKGLSTTGHVRTWGLDLRFPHSLNASGDETATQAGEVLSEQVTSQNEESHGFSEA